MNTLEAPKRPGTFAKGQNGSRVNLLKDAKDAEQVTINEIRKGPKDLADLSSLVRSFVALVDCIQRLRGIPTPGQLRPDLDPVQIARMLKRAKARQPIDLEQIGDGKFYDEPEPKKVASKESLSKVEGVTAEGGGEGAESERGSL